MTTEALAVQLPEPIARRGITAAQYRTLKHSLYPGASMESICLVWDYCVARRLDPLKKPVHIVPVDVKVGDRYESREIVMTSIYEARTTAQRTGEYLGHSAPVYGPTIDVKGVKAPESVSMTFYRAHPNGRIEFPITTYFREVVATTRDGKPNARWSRAPIQMLTKCCEAAGLREAFPDEIGGEHVEEEIAGQRAIDAPAVTTTEALVEPPGFEEWLTDLTAVADEGAELFAAAWAAAAPEMRAYLTAAAPETYERLKARAAAPPESPK